MIDRNTSVTEDELHVYVDGELPADVLAKVRALPQVQQAKPLKF